MAKGGEEAKVPVRSRVKKKAAKAAVTETDDCRCKEMSKKTPRELLKVAIDDLSFWKKKK
ncbi:MAG: hypothetical protein M0Z71_12680 [Nitrospiraceae bacterium]|nr:hypothetical protein [Nitrospiraceae bacterium]